jgi:hypothetical protein
MLRRLAGIELDMLASAQAACCGIPTSEGKKMYISGESLLVIVLVGLIAG